MSQKITIFHIKYTFVCPEFLRVLLLLLKIQVFWDVTLLLFVV